MRSIKHIVLLLGGIMLSVSSMSQQRLSIESYVRNILEYHPYIKIANNKLLKSEFKLKASRGAFDPKISGSWDIKQYDGKTYYNLQNGKLKLPNRTGVAPIVKYQNNSGYYLNAQNSNPVDGILGAGIEIPLLNGLLIDGDRLKFRISKLELDKQVFSNDSAINIILANSIRDYLSWITAYYQFEAMTELLNVRKTRFVNTKNAFAGGSISPMDTLDAFAQLQKTERDQLYAKVIITKFYYKVLNNLWDPLLIASIDSVLPSSYSDVEAFLIPKASAFLVDEHNTILAMAKQLDQQKVQQQFYREQFKPKLNLELLPLAAVSNPFDNNLGFNQNNGMAGLTLELPLYYRKQTNNYRISKLEIENLNAKLEYQKRKLINSYQTNMSNVSLLKRQVDISTQNIQYFQTLKSMEEEKYLMGESDLIKLNLRENKFIDEQLKLFSTSEKYVNELIDLNIVLQSLN